MEVGIAFVAGIAIGWLIEWLIDWQYWRRGVADFYATESRLRSELASSEEKERASEEQLRQVQSDLASARAQLQAARVREAELQRRLQTATAQPASEATPAKDAASATARLSAETRSDDLKRITGVGPIYEQRMHDAGVHTFEQLARASTDELEEIIQPPAWVHIDFSEWRQQAHELAAQPNDESHGA